MPTLSYCKSVNNCSPNLLHFKVARNEKLYFGPFFLALRFGPALHICLFILHNAHHALPCFLPTPCSAFALSAFDMSPCPALSCHVFPCPVFYCPALPAKSPISGRSDRKVLRLIYIYNIYIYRLNSSGIMIPGSANCSALSAPIWSCFLGFKYDQTTVPDCRVLLLNFTSKPLKNIQIY